MHVVTESPAEKPGWLSWLGGVEGAVFAGWVRASSSADIWTRVHPVSELPQLLNPVSGWSEANYLECLKEPCGTIFLVHGTVLVEL